LNTQPTTQQKIRDYLLGSLPEDQLADVEERLLTDHEFYEELLIVEDELVDEYLHGELPTVDRTSFESHFVSAPEHKEKVRFARTLRKYVSAESIARSEKDSATADLEAPGVPSYSRKPRLFGFLPTQNPMWGYAMSAAMILIVVGFTWVVWQNALSPRGPGKVLAAVLTPGLTRGEGEGTNTITIPAGTDTIRLQLLLPENRYPTYHATLLDSESRPVITNGNLKPDSVNGQPAVMFDVDANLQGDYRVKLSGVNPNGNIEALNSYFLRIQKQ
jgi:hypothetical protein